MDDSGFLRDLARTAREEEAEEQQRWDRWDRLTDGAVSPEVEAELRALAATSVDGEQAFEAFRPLSPDFRARMVATIGPLVKGDPAPTEVVAPIEEPVLDERPRPITEVKSRRGFTFPSWRLAFAGPGLAGAAVALYLIFWPPAVPPELLVEIQAISTSRGEGAPFVPGGQFKADVWPKKEFSRQLEPKCYLEVAEAVAEKIRAIECAVSKHSDTAWMSIEGSLPEKLPIGSATLWVVLAYPDHQPDADTVGKLDKATQSRWHGWSAQPTPIEIRAP